MTGYQVTAQPVVGAHGQLEIDRLAFLQTTQRGHAEGFLRNVGHEAVAGRLEHGQTGSGDANAVADLRPGLREATIRLQPEHLGRLAVRVRVSEDGVKAALRVSAALHAIFAGALVALGAVEGSGWVWWAGVGVVAVLLVYEHAIVRPDDLKRVNAAFFTVNGVVSVFFGALVVTDLLSR